MPVGRPAGLSPVMGSVNGYGMVAKNAINDTLYRQTVRPMGGVTGGYAGVASQGVRNSPLANEVRAANRGRRMAGINAAKARSKAMRGVDTGMMHGPSRPPAAPMRVMTAGDIAGPQALKKAGAQAARFKPRTMMGIGLGLGVAASVAMNRRGEGASSGRQSIYKY